MDRPSKEELAMCMTVTHPGADIGANVACVLKAEMLALQVELSSQAQLQSVIDAKVDAIDLLRATIARVEALPAKWREKAARPRSLLSNAEHALATFTFEGCADELEAALRGEK